MLITDFGWSDPYVGQVKAVLLEQAGEVPVVDLCHDLTDYNIRAAAYFIPAYVQYFPTDTIFLCVVDPGVGSQREACVARLGRYWFVAPDNGLLSVVNARSQQKQWWSIEYDQQKVSHSFHGRDVFAPVAARLAQGDLSALRLRDEPSHSGIWPDDLAEIIYIDHYGNLVSGFRFAQLPRGAELHLAGHIIPQASVFADVEKGQAFYYCNANGLLEIAVNQGRARDVFRASVGDKLGVVIP